MPEEILSLQNRDFLSVVETILKQGNSIKFKAKGKSMLPLIKDGDILKISPSTDDIVPGDIVLYHNRKDEAVVHRFVAKFIRENRVYILTKGDAALGYDEPIFQEQILGKVIDIQKKKTPSLRGILSIAFHRIQGLGLYGRLAKIFIQPEKQISVEMREDDNLVNLMIKKKDRVIGYTELSPDVVGEKSWIMSSLWVHYLYRRIGLATKIVEHAIHYTKERQGKEIRVYVSKSNDAAIGLYKNLGFILMENDASHLRYGREFIQLKRDVENISYSSAEIWN